jgi:hypothetical protein
MASVVLSNKVDIHVTKLVGLTFILHVAFSTNDSAAHLCTVLNTDPHVEFNYFFI